MVSAPNTDNPNNPASSDNKGEKQDAKVFYDNSSSQDYQASGRYVLKNAGISLLIGIAAWAPFLIVAILISILGFSETSQSASSMQASRVILDIGTLALAVTGAIMFAKRTSKRNNFIVFILAVLLADIPYNFLAYLDVNQALAGFIALGSAFIVFFSSIMVFVKLSRLHNGFIYNVLLLIPIGIALIAVFSYFSINGNRILSNNQLRLSLGPVYKLNFALYGPASGSGWDINYAMTESANCGPNVLFLSLTGPTDLEVYEGTNSNLLSGSPDCGNGSSNSNNTSLNKMTSNGLVLYTSNPEQQSNIPMYASAATKVRGTYIFVSDADGNSHVLSFYSDFIHELKPLSKSDLKHLTRP